MWAKRSEPTGRLSIRLGRLGAKPVPGRRAAPIRVRLSPLFLNNMFYRRMCSSTVAVGQQSTFNPFFF